MSDFPINQGSLEASSGASVPDEEINLLELVTMLAKHKWLILGLSGLATIVAVVVSLQLPIIFTATTRIFPPQQGQSTTASILSQLGGIGALVGGGAGIKNPNDFYIGMLKSRTVADNLIQRFDLMKLYEAKLPSRARMTLDKMTTISSGKDNIITIEVDDEDPKRAAEMANAYVEELLKLTSVLAITEASQRRLFFERQVAQAKDNLGKAELLARQALQTRGLVKVDDQGKAMVEATARVRGQITVKEVQIGAMSAYAADRNPDLVVARRELESLKRELAKLEGAGTSGGPSMAQVGQGIDSLALLRDVKYHEVIYESLARQYEVAKIDEAKDSPVIQVMDKAIEPDFRSKPKRTRIVFMSAVAGMFIGILSALLIEFFLKARGDPRQAEYLRAIGRHLSWRRLEKA
jgi:tyrosine-protein kinase Etk/Wzc